MPHTWAISEFDACRQYLILLRRVKKAAGCKPSHELAWIRSKFKWFTIEGLDVRSLWVLPGVRFLVQGMLFQFGLGARRGTAPMHTCKKIASRISVYLGTLDAVTLPKEAFLTFRISPSTLRPLDRRRLTAKSKEHTLGSLGIVPWEGFGPHPLPRVVLVEQVYQRVDIAAVSASLDMCSFFALGDRKTTTRQNAYLDMAAWHAVRVHHRCRLLYPPDAPPDLRTALLGIICVCLTAPLLPGPDVLWQLPNSGLAAGQPPTSGLAGSLAAATLGIGS